MKKIILIILALITINNLFAQRYYTKTGNITFDASSSVVDVIGINNTVISVFDINSGQFEFSSNIKEYHFKQSLMEEHFNENYMDSEKYPKSTFKGFITNISSVNFNKDGVYPVSVKGILEIHNVKRNIETTGTFTINGGVITSNSEFKVALKDYNIEVPGVVVDAISDIAKIKVNCVYTIMK
jgi:polyisoprenoid-binding protein YceI